MLGLLGGYRNNIVKIYGAVFNEEDAQKFLFNERKFGK